MNCPRCGRALAIARNPSDDAGWAEETELVIRDCACLLTAREVARIRNLAAAAGEDPETPCSAAMA